MPDNTRAVYEEAQGIVEDSPRGAAALLRLAIQYLCADLGEHGKLDDAIGNLVSRGLPKQVQQALDTVRVVGNNAVHPGEIDVDDRETAGALFDLLNLITEYMIALPDQVDNLYQSLPQGARDHVDKRDGNP
jgi:hypothetical protein